MDDSPNTERVTLCDALDRLLSSGIVAHGDIVITVADVDLLRISLRALVAATDAICSDIIACNSSAEDQTACEALGEPVHG